MKWEAPAFNQSRILRIDLNQERRDEQARLYAQNCRRLFWLGILLISSLALVIATRQIVQKRAQLLRVQRQVEDSDKRLQSLQKVNNELDTKQSRWTQLLQSQQRRGAWRDTLTTLAEAMPPSMYADQIHAEEKAPKMHISVQGAAEAIEAVKQCVYVLTKAPQISRVRLTETAANRALGPGGINYKIEADMDLPQ
jgi:Tfp pilus assembly protein PilN